MTKTGIQAQVEEGVANAQKSFLQEIKQLLGMGRSRVAAPAAVEEEDEDSGSGEGTGESGSRGDGAMSELQETIKALAVEIKNLRASVATLQTEGKNKVAAVQEEATSAIEAKEEEVSTRANIKARQTLAKAGHTAVAEEEAANGTPAKSQAQLWEDYHKQPNATAKRAFYLAHKDALNG